MNIEIKPIPAFRDNYIWTLINRDNQSAVCVDPGDAEPVIAILAQEDLKLTAILITHHHWDHTNGIKKLVKHFQAPVFGPHKEAIPKLTHPLQEGDEITLDELDLSLTVLEIPGHTLGHIAFTNQKLVFCGDTLFTAGCGRIFEGTVDQMYNSLQKLSRLPEETLVYCGHEYTEANLNFAMAVEPQNQAIQKRLQQVRQQRQQKQATVPATLQVEHLTNPFLRTEQQSVKEAAERITDKQLATPMDVFSTIRQWKDRF
ncbi:MAG: hydroxyacylglutathione hydrolase [Gammaproteobacteria bacterium]